MFYGRKTIGNVSRNYTEHFQKKRIIQIGKVANCNKK